MDLSDGLFIGFHSYVSMPQTKNLMVVVRILLLA